MLKRYPPSVIVCYAGSSSDILKGELAAPIVEEMLRRNCKLNIVNFAPSRQWLDMMTGHEVAAIRRLGQLPGLLSPWVGMTTIAADAFRVQTHLADQEIISSRLKQSALLFDQIAIYDLVPSLVILDGFDIANELRWLLNEGIVCQPEVDDLERADLSDEYIRLADLASDDLQTMFALIGKATQIQNAEPTAKDLRTTHVAVADALSHGAWSQARSAAAWFRMAEDVGITAIMDRPLFYTPSTARDGAATVLEVLLKAFPIPDETTSWEQIREFRSEPDNRRRIAALRAWMSETARSALKPHEIADKITWLLEQYTAQLKLNRLKYRIGSARFLLSVVTDVATELANRRFTAAADALFGLSTTKTQLLEAELQSPGCEVAYVVAASERFRPRA
jgi:hypothetical protein